LRDEDKQALSTCKIKPNNYFHHCVSMVAFAFAISSLSCLFDFMDFFLYQVMKPQTNLRKQSYGPALVVNPFLVFTSCLYINIT
jgi:hypothetical protein